MRRLLPAGVLLSCALICTNAAAQKAKLPAAEKEKIEALIKHVEGLKDAKFVRNKKEYDAATAAEFLRRKWKANEADVKSARDFIDKIASVSGSSGEAYTLRLKGKKDVASKDYLLEELKKLEKAAPDKDK